MMFNITPISKSARENYHKYILGSNYKPGMSPTDISNSPYRMGISKIVQLIVLLYSIFFVALYKSIQKFGADIYFDNLFHQAMYLKDIIIVFIFLGGLMLMIRNKRIKTKLFKWIIMMVRSLKFIKLKLSSLLKAVLYIVIIFWLIMILKG